MFGAVKQLKLKLNDSENGEFCLFSFS